MKRKKDYVELDKIVIQCPECGLYLYRKGDLKVKSIGGII